MQQDADSLIQSLVKEKNVVELAAHYVITFLGKGWEKHVERMQKAGYEVLHIRFAPNYIEEVCKHNIQLTPICIGTGTKGKVLDAIANGLLVIGSWYALENIAVENKISVLQYDYVEDVITILNELKNDVQKYHKMTETGRQVVLREHQRALISKQLMDLFK